MTGQRGKQRVIDGGVAVVGLLGIVAIIAGTFAPWLDSGTVSRNLYRATGIAARIGVFGSGSALTTLLPLLGPACLVPVVLAVLGARRTAAVAALVLALACGAGAATALIVWAGRSVVGISLAPTGPIVLVIGSVLVVLAAVTMLLPRAPSRLAAGRLPGIDSTAVGGPSR